MPDMLPLTPFCRTPGLKCKGLISPLAVLDRVGFPHKDSKVALASTLLIRMSRSARWVAIQVASMEVDGVPCQPVAPRPSDSEYMITGAPPTGWRVRASRKLPTLHRATSSTRTSSYSHAAYVKFLLTTSGNHHLPSSEDGRVTCRP